MDYLILATAMLACAVVGYLFRDTRPIPVETKPTPAERLRGWQQATMMNAVVTRRLLQGKRLDAIDVSSIRGEARTQRIRCAVPDHGEVNADREAMLVLDTVRWAYAQLDRV